jgi:hypothetical protein
VSNVTKKKIFWGIIVGLVSLVALYFSVLEVLLIMGNANMIYLNYLEKILVIVAIFIISIIFGLSIILKIKALRIASYFLLVVIAAFFTISLVKLMNIPRIPLG